MADTAYTYAVARIRAKEVTLLSDSDIEQLVSCKTYDACMTYLREKGWGTGDREETAEDMLASEEKKLWQDMEGLVPDDEIFSVFTIPKQYHNLKAAIKQVCTGDDKAEHIFYEDLEPSPEQLKEMVSIRDFYQMDKHMADAAAEATETLLQTQDGQLCDIIIDQASLEAMKSAGAKSGSQFLKNYADNVVAVADIRMAVRCAKTGKTKDFMDRALAQCDSLDIAQLAKAAEAGVSQICEYLEVTAYSQAAEEIQKSFSAFERWCDNAIMDSIKEQKYNSFSEGPVLAYVLARENEIKTVRIILTGKINHLSEEFIRERVRKMYV